jgi:chromate transporter
MESDVSLLRLFFCFLRIGCISFGGFMSLVSMIETQVVGKRRWLSEEDMLDGIALASLLPGPMAVNTVAYVGYRLRGGIGALISAFAVLIPTTILMLVLTELYFRYGSTPQVERVFNGILPAVAAIVLSVSVRMGKSTLRGRWEWVALGFALLLLILTPRSLKIYATFGLVALYGLAGYLAYVCRVKNYFSQEDRSVSVDKLEGSLQSSRQRRIYRGIGWLFLGCVAFLGVIPLPFDRNGLGTLASTFGSMSLTLFGGGYVFIPMIQDVVVGHFEWLTAKEFIDGIALGQITPGPILISALFIGQRVAGFSGAMLSTLAIFGPPAMLMVMLAGMLDRIKGSQLIKAVMRGIRIAVIGLIFRAFVNIFMLAWPAGDAGVMDYFLPLLVFVLSFMALYRFKVDVVWLIPAAGIVGFLAG